METILTVVISQEPKECGEHEGEYFVTISNEGQMYKKYYTFLPDFETVKSDFEIFKEDFEEIIKKDT